MSTAAIVIIAVAAEAVLLAISIVAERSRRRRRLRERFGPEYDRTINVADNSRQAEADLRQRAEERDHLSIQPLSADQRERFEQNWRQVQAEFVDVPGTSLARADALVTEVMIHRGYPLQDFDDRARLVSVDHPRVVEQYRQAHGTFLASQSDPVPTEKIRQAFVSYRSLFFELVADGTSAANQTPAGDASTASY